jgi:hypothetical protein
MFLKVVRVFFGERRVINDQQVFRVVLLCRFDVPISACSGLYL